METEKTKHYEKLASEAIFELAGETLAKGFALARKAKEIFRSANAYEKETMTAYVQKNGAMFASDLITH